MGNYINKVRCTYIVRTLHTYIVQIIVKNDVLLSAGCWKMDTFRNVYSLSIRSSGIDHWTQNYETMPG